MRLRGVSKVFTLLDEPLGALDALTRLKLQQEPQRLWLDVGITDVASSLLQDQSKLTNCAMATMLRTNALRMPHE